MRFQIAYLNDAGRRRENQDSLYFASAKTPSGGAVCAAVCDGMGGLTGGAEASAAMVRDVDAWFTGQFAEKKLKGKRLAGSMRDLAGKTGEMLNERGRSGNYLMGTTCSMLVIEGSHFTIMNIGDSRVYRIRRGKAEQLTLDQTLAMQEIAMGRMSPEEAENAWESTVLLMCVGASSETDPEFVTGRVKSGDCFLLCSDGFRRKLKKEEIAEGITRAGPGKGGLGKALKVMGAEAFALGESDNITAVAVRCGKDK